VLTLSIFTQNPSGFHYHYSLKEGDRLGQKVSKQLIHGSLGLNKDCEDEPPGMTAKLRGRRGKLLSPALVTEGGLNTARKWSLKKLETKGSGGLPSKRARVDDSICDTRGQDDIRKSKTE
jgi:hypothetical protein